jgi:hypothetical protein
MSNPQNQAEQDSMLSAGLLRGIFGRTTEEQAEFVGKLADRPEWAEAGDLVEKAAAMAPEGATHVVPCLQIAGDFVKAFALVVSFDTGPGNWPVKALLAVASEYENQENSVANYTPAEGSWAEWRKAAKAEAADQAAEEKRAAKEAEQAAQADQAASKASDQAAQETRGRQVRWFSCAYHGALYSLFGEGFISGEEKDRMAAVFETKGKLRPEADAARALRDQVMASCQVPVEVGPYQEPTEAEIAGMADVVASWINGELSGLKNPLQA